MTKTYLHAWVDRVPRLPRFVIISGIIGICLIVSGVILNMLVPFLPNSTAHNKAASTASTSTHTSSVSPLIFGTNLDLSQKHDQTFLTISPTLQGIPVRAVRLAPSPNLDDAALYRIAEAIRRMNAVPVVVLQGTLAPNAMTENTRIVRIIQSVFFGEVAVYYEYGNEEDALAVNTNTYTVGWNKAIPELKKLAPGAFFLGPVTYRYDENYLKTFLNNANPRPDGVSWHEYSCDNNWPRHDCLSHLNDWSKHFQSARTVMKAAIGKEVPIIISEWNYAPNSRSNDEKSNDATFLKTWTTQALQTLAENHVFAAMHCSCLGNVTDLIDANSKTTVLGSIFHRVYPTFSQQFLPPAPTMGLSRRLTATATGIANDPYLTGKGTLLVSDPLSKPYLWQNKIASDWGGICAFKGGVYSIRQSIADNRYFHCDAGTLHASNFIYEVQVTLLKGDCGGITFRYNAESHAGYRFLVCANGIVRLLAYPNGATYKRLLDEPVPAVRSGYNQNNTLAVVASGSTLDLYVNKQKIGSFTDNTLSDGMFALFAAAFDHPTEVTFRNANVRRL